MKRVGSQIPGSPRVQLLVFVAIFGAVGAYFLFATKAATPTANFEAESGTRTSQATLVSDGTASGGQAVQFKAATSPGGGGFGSTTSSCTSYSGPITITQGGTYTGCWQTTTPGTNAVTIATSQPVTIINSTMKGNYRLIGNSVNGINLTVKNSYFIGVTPSGGVDSRRAMWVTNPSNIRLENNYLENTAGFKVIGWSGGSSANNTVTVLRNYAKNITGVNQTGSDWAVQFIQFDSVTINNIEIAWNQVINEFGKSKVEDNINFFNSGGTSSSYVSIHDNFIWGAYPPNLGDGYSGGGIIMGDAYDSTLHGYFNVFNNQVVGSVNYGISIVGGSYNNVYNNRLVNSQRTASGQQFTGNSGSLGLSFWNAATGTGPYEHNTMHDNYVAWWSSNGSCCHRNDWWTPNATGTNTFYSNTQYQPTNAEIPYSMEQAEYTRWQDKVSTAGVKIGPQ